jgi:hypothetical protein
LPLAMAFPVSMVALPVLPGRELAVSPDGSASCRSGVIGNRRRSPTTVLAVDKAVPAMLVTAE